jgi:hypothetical protein
MGEIDRGDVYRVMDAHFREYGLGSQQISSYNRFINNIVLVVKECGTFRVQPKDQFLPGSERVRTDEFY